jgi:hypothetical protein
MDRDGDSGSVTITATTSQAILTSDPIDIWQRLRLKGTDPAYAACFGEEAFRTRASFGALIGWRVIGDLLRTASKICDTLDKIILDKIEGLQRKRRRAKGGQGSFDAHSYSLQCFLIGIAKSYASPHVTVICGDEWISKRLKRIINTSKLLNAYPGWRCFRLAFVVELAAPEYEVPTMPTSDAGYKVFLSGENTAFSMGLSVEIRREASYVGKATIGGILVFGEIEYGLTVAHVFLSYRRPEPHDFGIDESELGFLETELEEADDDKWSSSEDEDLDEEATPLPSLLGQPEDEVVDKVPLGDIAYVSDMEVKGHGSSAGLDWALISIQATKMPRTMKLSRYDSTRESSLEQWVGKKVTVITSSADHHGVAISTGVFGLPMPTQPHRVLVVKVDGIKPGDSGSWAVESHSQEPLGMLLGVCQPLGEAYILSMNDILLDIERQSKLSLRNAAQDETTGSAIIHDRLYPKDEPASDTDSEYDSDVSDGASTTSTVLTAPSIIHTEDDLPGKTSKELDITEKKLKLKVFAKEVPRDMMERFQDVKRLFTAPLLKALRDSKRSSGNISIKLKYIGEDLDSARLYILVMCEKQAAFKTVKRFFSSPWVLEMLGNDFLVRVLVADVRRL